MKTTSNKKRTVIFLVIVVLAVLGWQLRDRLKPSTAASVPNADITTVAKGEFIQRVTIAGAVQPARKTLITANYRGYVKKLYVKVGDNVKLGEPIASVVTSLTTEEPVFPLRSPLSGKVVQVLKEEGEFVKEADPTDYIARIDDLSKMYVSANAPELDRIKIKLGQEATVKVSAVLDRVYKARVSELSLASKPAADQWQRSSVVEYPIKLQLLDFDDRLEPGMTVLIDIVSLKKTNVLYLRHEFIGHQHDKYYVTLVDGTKVPIEVGDQNEESAEILSGVKEGDQVRKVDFSAVP